MAAGDGNVWDIRSVGMAAAVGARCDSTDRGPPQSGRCREDSCLIRNKGIDRAASVIFVLA